MIVDSESTDHSLGMFLYARLVLDYIKSNIFYSSDELRTAIDQLPDSLNDLYVRHVILDLVRN